MEVQILNEFPVYQYFTELKYSNDTEGIYKLCKYVEIHQELLYEIRYRGFINSIKMKDI